MNEHRTLVRNKTSEFWSVKCIFAELASLHLNEHFHLSLSQLVKTGEGRVLVLNVSQRDSGEYLCEAQTKMGSQRSRPVPLEVNMATGEQKFFHLWV